jgi:hypothetical protein
MPKFFVNRSAGRVPEGPFEEQQIVHFIRTGKLTKGYVCAVGAQRFVALDREPAFARALVDAGHALESQPRPPVFATKSTSRGLLLLSVLSIFVLALSAVGIGSYVMFGTGGMPIRAALPTDTQAFFEIENVPVFAAELAKVRSLDSELVAKGLFDSLATELSADFGVPKAHAESLVFAAKSLGLAVRGGPSERQDGAFLSFDAAAPVNAFLSSKRFTYSGLVAKSGRKYELASASSDPTTKPGALSALTLNSESTVLVWFETSKVLFVGSLRFAESVARVVSLDAPSIEQTPGFHQARRAYAGTPNAALYVFDPAKLLDSAEPAIEAALSAYVRGGGPIAGRVDLVPAGLLLRVDGDFNAGTTTPTGAPQSLTLIDRLPLETFAYAAWSASAARPTVELARWLSGAALHFASPTDTPFDQTRKKMASRLCELASSDVEEAAVALLAPSGDRLASPVAPSLRAEFAIACAAKLSDEAHARALGTQIATELSLQEPALDLHALSDGFQALSKTEGGISAELRFSNGDLIFALGNQALVTHALSAFATGRETLAGDAAERAARALLPKLAQFVSWLDVGRVLDASQKNPLVSASFHDLGLSAVRLTGAGRATAALSLFTEVHAGNATYHVDALNFPLLAWPLWRSGG